MTEHPFLKTKGTFRARPENAPHNESYGEKDYYERNRLLLVLRVAPQRGRRSVRRQRRCLHLRPVHRARTLAARAEQGRARQQKSQADPARGTDETGRHQGLSGPVRYRTGRGQAPHGRRRIQPLQEADARAERRKADRDRQVEHPDGRSDRYGQDADGPDDRQAAESPVHDRRRDRTDRGGLRGRRRREHPLAAASGGRLRRSLGRTGNRLYRRDRQDRPQGRQPVDHARRVGRGRTAGPAQDSRGNGGQRAAASTPSRSSSPSTRRTSCSSAEALSTASRKRSPGGSTRRPSATANCARNASTRTTSCSTCCRRT